MLVSMLAKNDGEAPGSTYLPSCAAVSLHLNAVGGNTLIFVSPGQFGFKYLHALFYIYDQCFYSMLIQQLSLLQFCHLKFIAYLNVFHLHNFQSCLIIKRPPLAHVFFLQEGNGRRMGGPFMVAFLPFRICVLLSLYFRSRKLPESAHSVPKDTGSICVWLSTLSLLNTLMMPLSRIADWAWALHSGCCMQHQAFHLSGSVSGFAQPRLTSCTPQALFSFLSSLLSQSSQARRLLTQSPPVTRVQCHPSLGRIVLTSSIHATSI